MTLTAICHLRHGTSARSYVYTLSLVCELTHLSDDMIDSSFFNDNCSCIKNSVHKKQFVKKRCFVDITHNGLFFSDKFT